MRLPIRGLLVISPVAVAVASGGCGSGKDQVSAADLAQKSDRICRQEQAKFDRIQGQPPANASIAADQTKELIDVSEAASSDLRDLEPPDSSRTPYDAYLDARDRAIDEMRKGRKAAENRDSAGYAAAQTAVAKAAPQRRHLAGALGFRVCGAKLRSG
jgi:hypothetical protein